MRMITGKHMKLIAIRQLGSELSHPLPQPRLYMEIPDLQPLDREENKVSYRMCWWVFEACKTQRLPSLIA